MAVPKLTGEQLQAAREAATRVRRVRAELKKSVRDGKISFKKAIAKCQKDEVLAQIKVVDLLRSVPRIGDRRAAQLMEKYSIADNRRIRGLGRNQLSGLLSEFN